MDLAFWYGLLAAVLGFFGVDLAEVKAPAWLQQGAEWIQESRSETDRAAEGAFEAKLAAVSDGDSIRVIDRNGRSRRVRLAYIDAPELQQAGGTAARDALRRLLAGQTLQIRVIEQDQYGRDVAQVFAEGKDVGLSQIENGQAWHYASYAKRGQNKIDYARYAYAQAVAGQERRGLWQAADPQAPWAYRKAQRTASPAGESKRGETFESLW